MSVYEKRKRSIIEDLDWNGSSYTASRLLKLLRQTLSLAITLYLTIYVSKINLKVLIAIQKTKIILFGMDNTLSCLEATSFRGYKLVVLTLPAKHAVDVRRPSSVV